MVHRSTFNIHRIGHSMSSSEAMQKFVDFDEVIRSACKTVLMDEDGEPLAYDPAMVTTWTSDVIKLILATLSEAAETQKKPFSSVADRDNYVFSPHEPAWPLCDNLKWSWMAVAQHEIPSHY